MLGFMDYVQNAFHSASNWDRDNSYGSLTATARALLDFDTPHGLRLNVSSLSSSNFATSYTLGSVGVVDGSLSYLYSSLPLHIPSTSKTIPLQNLIQGYRQLRDLRTPDEPWWWEIWHQGKRVDRRDTLLYGHLHLPTSYLSALYLRRLTPTTLLKISTVSSSSLPSGGTILTLLSHSTAKYSTDYLFSTDSALFGIRGLYNFGPPLLPTSASDSLSLSQISEPQSQSQSGPSALPNGRFSAGGEIYYAPLNKSGGISTGIRFATLPRHSGFPYTMTLTLNPLMGNLSSTYAVQASPALALCSRFDFNVYSYESDFWVGMELWRARRTAIAHENESEQGSIEWARWKMQKLAWEAEQPLRLAPTTIEFENSPHPSSLSSLSSTPSQTPPQTQPPNDPAGVLKARITQDLSLSLRWESRAKALLYSCGLVVDLKKRDQVFRGVGVEVGYSS